MKKIKFADHNMTIDGCARASIYMYGKDIFPDGVIEQLTPDEEQKFRKLLNEYSYKVRKWLSIDEILQSSNDYELTLDDNNWEHVTVVTEPIDYITIFASTDDVLADGVYLDIATGREGEEVLIHRNVPVIHNTLLIPVRHIAIGEHLAIRSETTMDITVKLNPHKEN